MPLLSSEKAVRATVLAVTATAIFLFCVEIYVLVTGTFTRGGPPPAFFGNSRKTMERLPPVAPGETFSFAVAGDTRGFGTFARLCSTLRKMPLSFMILLGDCVHRPKPDEHAYFLRKLHGPLRVPFPVFYVVGNRDVNASCYSLSKWEKTYGPSLFSFEYGGALFVFLDVRNPSLPSTSITYLEHILKNKRARNRYAFVFMHRPVSWPSSFGIKGGFRGESQIQELCARYKVTYVISGDYHGYIRSRKGNTVYIITGAGGAPLHDPFLHTHHALIITVSPHGIYERFVSTPRHASWKDVIDYTAVTVVFPMIKTHPITTAGVTILIAACALGGIFILVRSPWKHSSSHEG